MKLNFCTQCGKPLIYKAVGDEGEQKYCPNSNKIYLKIRKEAWQK